MFVNFDDDKLTEVERFIRRLGLDELQKVAYIMGVDQQYVEGKRKMEIALEIFSVLDEVQDPTTLGPLLLDVANKLSDQTRTKFLHIITLAPTSTDIASKENKADVKEEEAKKKTEVTGTTNSNVKTEVKNTSLDLSTTLELLKAMGQNESGASTRYFKKEFKIQGTIGADGLNFISLCGQITEGREKGYSDKDITIAIRKAVTPGTTLRTYLDATTERSLNDVVSFIRSCMKEKTASALYAEMTNFSQKSDEDAQAFVLRALELREKVIKSSDFDSSIKFDRSIVESTFKNAVLTGLTSDQTRMRLEGLLLSDVHVTDGVLIQKVNSAMSLESETRAKLNAATKSQQRVQVNQVCVEGGDLQVLQKSVTQLTYKMNEMVKEMNEMRKSNSTATHQMKPINNPNSSHQQKPAQQQQVEQYTGNTYLSTGRMSMKCRRCEKDNVAMCTHCWMCGETGHRRARCPLKDSLNQQPLPCGDDG